MAYTTPSLAKALKADLLRAVQAEPSLIPMLATVVPSQSNNETYSWLAESAFPQRFDNAPLEVTPLRDTSYTITAQKFGASIGISRDDLNDNMVGSFRMRVQDLIRQGLRHREKLLIDALINGDVAGNTTFTGDVLITDTHAQEDRQSGTQDNLLASAGTSVANLRADMNAAIGAMMAFEDESGQPMFPTLSELTVVCPVEIMVNFREALGAGGLSNNNPSLNVFGGFRINLVPSARLSADDSADWYLLNTGEPIKPLIFQDREPLTLEESEGGSEEFFMEKKFFKVRGRYNVGYSHWQKVVKVA